MIFIVMEERKKCTKCGDNKLLCEFAKDKYNKDGLTFSCKTCRNIKAREYREANPEMVKERNLKNAGRRKEFYESDEGIKSSRRAHLKRMFGITLEEYDKMCDEQNHVCGICGGVETSYRNKVLSVDHDHESGKIRGLLCNTCNRGLGLFKDDIEHLKKAIEYLNKS